MPDDIPENVTPFHELAAMSSYVCEYGRLVDDASCDAGMLNRCPSSITALVLHAYTISW